MFLVVARVARQDPTMRRTNVLGRIEYLIRNRVLQFADQLLLHCFYEWIRRQDFTNRRNRRN